ncbi:MAG: hypothetical protein RRY35_01795 [Clostridiales bacterium]
MPIKKLPEPKFGQPQGGIFIFFNRKNHHHVPPPSRPSYTIAPDEANPPLQNDNPDNTPANHGHISLEDNRRLFKASLKLAALLLAIFIVSLALVAALLQLMW